MQLDKQIPGPRQNSLCFRRGEESKQNCSITKLMSRVNPPLSCRVRDRGEEAPGFGQLSMIYAGAGPNFCSAAFFSHQPNRFAHTKFIPASEGGVTNIRACSQGGK
jgi:hypothetical protein